MSSAAFYWQFRSRHSADFLNTFGNVLLFNCVIDLVYTVVAAIVFPGLEIIDGRFFLMPTGLLRDVSPTTACASIMLGYHTMLFFCVCAVGMQFFYRYVTICRGGATREGFVRLLSVTVAMTMSHGIMGFYAFFPNDEVNAQSRLLLENKLGATDIPTFIVGRIKDPKIAVYFLHGISILAGVYILVALTGFKIWRTINSAKDVVSERTRQLQKRLTHVLFIQAVVPFLVLVLPLLVNSCLTLLHHNSEVIPVLTITLLAWLPATNAFSAILCVPSYRQGLLRILRRKTTVYTEASRQMEVS
ncbi:Protein Y9C9A.5 [Aphelenchoides avenae]|nr:Protein Y9C9A.5 [Aphelenchus avenae]